MIRKYADRFFVRIEHIAIQGNHFHLLVRAPRRSQFHHFFRVLAGQMAQELSRQNLLVRAQNSGRVTDTQRRGTGLWILRPFSRVVQGYRAYIHVQDYIQLNLMEALGLIPYRKERLRGLSKTERLRLWSQSQ